MTATSALAGARSVGKVVQPDSGRRLPSCRLMLACSGWRVGAAGGRPVAGEDEGLARQLEAVGGGGVDGDAEQVDAAVGVAAGERAAEQVRAGGVGGLDDGGGDGGASPTRLWAAWASGTSRAETAPASGPVSLAGDELGAAGREVGGRQGDGVAAVGGEHVGVAVAAGVVPRPVEDVGDGGAGGEVERGGRARRVGQRGRRAAGGEDGEGEREGQGG
jgi:hypothetical protein